jgi:peptide/nickel transport system substrate-binding protein
LALAASAACRESRGPARAARAKTEAGPQRAGAGLASDVEIVPTCGEAETGAPGAFGGVLKVLLNEEPPHLDPLDDPPRSTLEVVGGLVYEPLIECRAGTYNPALAERWEWNEDRTRLQLQLRSGVQWHDGEPLTAADVQASLEAALRRPLSVAAASLAEVKAVEAAGAGAVRLRVSSGGAGVLDALCDVPIVPAAASRGARRRNLREHPVGTGVFRLAGWERGRRIRLVRHTSAWRGASAAEELLFEVDSDPWRGLVRARSGQFDLASVPSQHFPDQVRRAALSPRVLLRRVREERTSFLAINHRHAPLSEQAVRRALSLLWNRAGLADELHQGLAEPIAVPFGEVPAPAFDPKLAARTLAEAGWQDENSDGVRERAGAPLRVGLLHAAAGGVVEIELRRFSSNLYRAGMRLEVSTVEPGVLLQRLRSGDFDLAALSWRGRAGEDPSPLFGGAGRFNYGGFRSARVESLLDQWRRAESPELRDRASRKLAAVLAEELPAIYLYRHDQVLLVRDRVRGLCSDGGRVDLRRAWLQDDPG